jgi:hypothetical protein
VGLKPFWGLSGIAFALTRCKMIGKSRWVYPESVRPVSKMEKKKKSQRKVRNKIAKMSRRANRRGK